MFYNILQNFPNDSGPIYQETIAGRLPVEPYNTFSNFIFILILFYFYKKIQGSSKKHPFFWFAIPVIAISWVGGTIYHGTRSHEFWLVLDWLPIMLVSFGGIVYFINKIYKTWIARVGFYLVFFFFLMLPRMFSLPEKLRISFGYFITALAVIGPFIYYAYLTNWKNSKDIFLGVFIFGIALTFRTLDNFMLLLPMGTHWLWHLFGGIAVFFMLNYIYKDRELPLS